MNRAKPGEWWDYAWSPITDFCARRFAARLLGRYAPTRFRPTYFWGRMYEPSKVKAPARIFLGPASDPFGDSMWDLVDPHRNNKVVGQWNTRQVWTDLVAQIYQSAWHTHILLTKNPANAFKIISKRGDKIPPNVWIGTSVANQADADKRIPELLKLREFGAKVLFVSYEPMLSPVNLFHYGDLDWMIFGAQTGPGAKQPAFDWVLHAIGDAEHHKIPYFVKDNVAWDEATHGPRPQEFPG